MGQRVRSTRSVVAMAAAASTLFSGAALAQESVPAFTPGEQTTWMVHYLGMNAGTAQVTVGSTTSQWGRAVWPIVAEARTVSFMAVYPVRDRFITYWDMEKNRSVGSDLVADEGHTKRRQRIVLDHDGHLATVTKQKEGERVSESTMEIEAGTADIAAATFAIRNEPLAVGRDIEVPVLTGAKIFKLKAHVDSKQMLKTAMGEREVYKVRASTDFSGKFQSKRDLTCYFTTDSAHVPVKLEAEFILGTISADLTEYKAGTALALK